MAEAKDALKAVVEPLARVDQVILRWFMVTKDLTWVRAFYDEVSHRPSRCLFYCFNTTYSFLTPAPSTKGGTAHDDGLAGGHVTGQRLSAKHMNRVPIRMENKPTSLTLVPQTTSCFVPHTLSLAPYTWHLSKREVRTGVLTRVPQVA